MNSSITQKYPTRIEFTLEILFRDPPAENKQYESNTIPCHLLYAHISKYITYNEMLIESHNESTVDRCLYRQLGCSHPPLSRDPNYQFTNVIVFRRTRH